MQAQPIPAASFCISKPVWLLRIEGGEAMNINPTGCVEVLKSFNPAMIIDRGIGYGYYLNRKQAG